MPYTWWKYLYPRNPPFYYMKVGFAVGLNCMGLFPWCHKNKRKINVKISKNLLDKYTCYNSSFVYCRVKRSPIPLRFKYTTKFSLPKIACPAIVYAEIVVVIDPFFVGVYPWIKIYRYNLTEICQQRLQGVRKVAQKLCSWERSLETSK